MELRRSVQQEQKKTATLTQEAKAAQAEMRREIESTTKQKQAAETAAAELRRSVQHEQKKTATLTQEAKAAQAEMRREIESTYETEAGGGNRYRGSATIPSAGAKEDCRPDAGSQGRASGDAPRDRDHRPRNRKRLSMKPCRRPPPNCEKPCSRSNRRLPP